MIWVAGNKLLVYPAEGKSTDGKIFFPGVLLTNFNDGHERRRGGGMPKDFLECDILIRRNFLSH